MNFHRWRIFRRDEEAKVNRDDKRVQRKDHRRYMVFYRAIMLVSLAVIAVCIRGCVS